MNNVIAAASTVEDKPGILATTEPEAVVLTTTDGGYTAMVLVTGLTDVATADGGAGLSTDARIVSQTPNGSSVDELVRVRKEATWH